MDKCPEAVVTEALHGRILALAYAVGAVLQGGFLLGGSYGKSRQHSLMIRRPYSEGFDEGI